MNSGAIYYANRDRLLILKFVGTIRIASREASQMSAGLEAFIRTLPQRDDFDQLLVDLSEASAIDSTHLGLLAQIAQFALTRWKQPATLISTNGDITAILESVCFDQVFRIVPGAAVPAADLEHVESVAASETDQVRLMLDAHRTLAQINPINEKQFRNVIDLLDEELQRSRSSADGTASSAR